MDSNAPDNVKIESTAGRAIRLLGFFALAGMALSLFAAVVLLPQYATLLALRHERDRQAVRTEEARRTAEALDRYVRRAPGDEILTKRLARSRLGMAATDELILNAEESLPDTPAPGSLAPIRLPDPPPPDARIMAAAEKLREPGQRRAALVLAVCMLASSLLLFAPPSWAPDRPKTGTHRKLPPPPFILKDPKPKRHWWQAGPKAKA